MIWLLAKHALHHLRSALELFNLTLSISLGTARANGSPAVVRQNDWPSIHEIIVLGRALVITTFKHALKTISWCFEERFLSR